MRIYTLESRTWVPVPLADVFAFHADAGNLQEITPPWLDFRVLTPRPIEMKAGALIEYRLALHGVPIRWQTRISLWDPPRAFEDRQLRGPYRVWEHRHEFEEAGGGTDIRDRVRYAVPLGVLVHGWLVAPDLRRIFGYRHEALLRRFGGSVTDQPAAVTLR